MAESRLSHDSHDIAAAQPELFRVDWSIKQIAASGKQPKRHATPRHMMSRESSAPDCAAEFENKIQNVQNCVDYEARNSLYLFSLSWTPSHSKSLLQLQASGGKMSRMSTDSYFEKDRKSVV